MARRILSLCALMVALAVALSVSARPSQYKVRKGDTLTAIAKRYDVSVTDLRRWNHIRRDHLKVGQVLSLKPKTKTYKVRRGDTLTKIAKREGITVAVLKDLNPGLTAKNLKAGQTIALYRTKADKAAAKRRHDEKKSAKKKSSKRSKKNKKAKTSRARKSHEKVDCPSRLEKVPYHVGYKRVHRDAAYATSKTLDAIDRGFDQLLRRHRLAPRVHFLDASRKDLSPVGNHRSHQEGRDVDITYYQRKCPRDGCPTRAVTPGMLDVKRQWTLLHYWIKRGDVEMMFIDHKLQEKLYAEAKRRGATKAQLERWFQYPRSPGTKEGLIRHWPGHKNHVHVRFESPIGKQRPCKEKKTSKRKKARRRKRR